MSLLSFSREGSTAGRRLARELTADELCKIGGANDTFTVYCTVPGQIDEDCELVTDCD